MCTSQFPTLETPKQHVGLSLCVYLSVYLVRFFFSSSIPWIVISEQHSYTSALYTSHRIFTLADDKVPSFFLTPSQHAITTL